MDSNSWPLRICKRLINFIMSKMFRPTPRDSEIVVEFRHADGSENWTQTDERTIVQKGLEKKEKQQLSSAPNSDQKPGTVARGKGIQELEAFSGTDARGKRPKKSVTIKEGETVRKKEAILLADQATKANNQPHQNTKPKPPRHWGPLLSVASNINEKCDAFISSRKKAMRKNYSLDPEKS